jgi:hypothetical protein
MLSQDRLELPDRLPINTLPACSCGSTQHGTPFPKERSRGLTSLVTALIVAALPKCPMCLLAYAGILGSLGLGSSAGETLYLAWLQPISVLFLGLTVILIALRARHRRGYGPALVATVAASTILLGKFWLDWLPLVYVGLLLIFLAVIWNAWPKKRR